MVEGTIAAAVLGVFIHHAVFIRGEWHLQSPSIFATHAAAVFILLAAQLHFELGNSRLAILTTLLYTACYLVGLFTSIVTYRLAFHRLTTFTGPRLAAVSKLWHVWKCRNSKNHLLLESLHQKYGTFVRTGPNEITIFHANGPEILLGSNDAIRGDWHDLLYPDVSPIFTRDRAIHYERRKMWDQAFSSESMTHYYKAIIEHIETFDAMIRHSRSQPISINEPIATLMLNAIGDIGFGQDFSRMKSTELKKVHGWMRSSLSLLGPFGSCTWIPRLILAYSPRVWKIQEWHKMRGFADDCMASRKLTRHQDKRHDMISFFLETFERKQGEPTWQSISGDATTILVAGSDTTASSIIFTLYFLARHPQDALKIQQELIGIDGADINALSRLKHLNGVINESMRLLPSIPTFGETMTPPEGLTIDGTFIPGNTKIIAPRYSISRLETAYEDPHRFIPERWYSMQHLIKDKRSYAPFGLGRTSCVGKKLSLMFIRLFVVSMLSKYDISAAPNTTNGYAVEAELKDQLTANAGELVLVFEPRQ
ncbi:benzoate 4-monooxygenase cytochrome P450 [Xylariaceae sp. FL1272]|nr:benzoate 4-monooxygenase cytochrome P450 [Xylariaceae sp. FL1272]